MSAFDQLERQLAESVAARARPDSPARRWWQALSLHQALVVAIAILFVVATLPGIFVSQPGSAQSGPSLLRAPAAARSESVCHPCQAVGGRLHAAPASEPAETADAQSRNPAREARARRGLPIMRWTAAAEEVQPTGGPHVG